MEEQAGVINLPSPEPCCPAAIKETLMPHGRPRCAVYLPLLHPLAVRDLPGGRASPGSASATSGLLTLPKRAFSCSGFAEESSLWSTLIRLLAPEVVGSDGPELWLLLSFDNRFITFDKYRRGLTQKVVLLHRHTESAGVAAVSPS